LATAVPSTNSNAPAASPEAAGLITSIAASPMREKYYRSLVKAVSWRATGTLDTVVVSYFVTGKIGLALSIGFVELFTKIALYYVHERVWDRISFGRARPSMDYEI
jgi:uncharacterized membrane protein